MLKLFGKIVNGTFVFSTPDHKGKQLDFAKKHHGLDFEINIIQIKRAEYFQHKYYRGCLLPSIADFYGSLNYEQIHFKEVKGRFLFYQIIDNNISTIPDSHKKGIMFFNDGENITGYTRSTSSLDYDEFVEFNKKVEFFLFDELNYRIIENVQDDAVKYKKAMESEIFAQEENIENFDEMYAF